MKADCVALLEVPSPYGESVRHFRAVDVDVVLDQFVKYAESKGADLS